jgi:hypothetical protein
MQAPRPKRPAKSIDGIVVPARQRRVYVMRSEPRDPMLHKPLVSIQPSQTPAVPKTKPVAVDAVKPVVRQPQRSIPFRAVSRAEYKERFENSDAVVRLPGGWSLRAQLSFLVQTIIIAILAIVGAYSTSVGQWFVLLYAVFVLVLRRDSRLTFGIALFILITVPIFQLLGQDGVANNMAVYVYELLVIGTVQAMIELKWPPKR